MASLRIVIDPGSGQAPFEQIRRQVADAVDAGALVAGTRMPTVRALAEELGLAVNTVARAYRELETDGVLDTRGRAGTFVRGDDAEAQARAAAREYADRATALGLTPAEALAFVERALTHR
ncbi:GntR family transcriptional regulator [Nocardioides fonticola]|uniref:GntR family transcriptional regulator n=1 Tax=Nocardioides fonticola TaxID=450363 RepID=A0ABP7XJ12_9ACTN